ncbi:3-deoxy-D-manno-octulosonic acid transferase [Xylophilus sp. ASV27]|uniref:3-deoxy-D-manno-octulosonic acid transferase n=1 Tax=Xylophilus sp. ASV27 TaxID=2795129 RepID=UPI0018ED64BB|nr:3-deoxy-D-manno-octulosonic acid transferase [Xylophilus sp. ASV27]
MRLTGPLARAAYSAGMWLAQPLLRRKLRRRAAAEPGYGEAVEERFGHYDAALRGWAAAGPGPIIWVHAVSLGETRAAAVLVAALRERLPGLRLLLTHGTATGRAEGLRLLQPGDRQVWQPWDTPAAVRRFLRTFRPALGLLMETEVWPNLVAGCRAQGVPLALANARLNARSLRRAERLAVLSRAAYGGLAAVWAQHADDAERLRALGAPVQGVFGNLKFDARPDAAQWARGRQLRAQDGRPVLLLASAREGEEALWLEAVRVFEEKVAAAQVVPGLSAINNIAQWLLVPRHPQRFDAVERLLREHGIAVSRRSAWQDGVPPPSGAVWLGDSLGEMAAYYGMADVALLGGSFAPLGGQNLIEAAACGCPVVMGPSTFNFADAATQAEAAGAAVRVADMAEAVLQATRLAQDPARRQAAAEAATAFAAAHRGAAARTAEAALALLGGPQRVE